MNIYVNGCSFTYGDELENPNLAWPQLLGSKLSASMTNDATSGGTNQRTVYRAIKNLSQNYDLYVIAWTSNLRYTFYRADDNYEINFNPQLVNKLCGNDPAFKSWGEVLYSSWHNELYSFKLWLQQIVQLQAMFKSHGKRYLMLNTFHNNLEAWGASKEQFIPKVKDLINFDIMNDEQIFAEYEEIQYYLKLVDRENFYQFDTFSLTDLTTQYKTGAGGHFLEEGHAAVSQLLYDHLCSK